MTRDIQRDIVRGNRAMADAQTRYDNQLPDDYWAEPTTEDIINEVVACCSWKQTMKLRGIPVDDYLDLGRIANFLDLIDISESMRKEMTRTALTGIARYDLDAFQDALDNIGWK